MASTVNERAAAAAAAQLIKLKHADVQHRSLLERGSQGAVQSIFQV